MVWVVDLKPDRLTRAAIRRLCSHDASLSVAPPHAGDVGVVVCSEQCDLGDLRELVATTGLAAQVIVLHVSGRAEPWAELAAGATDVLTWQGEPGPVCDKVSRLGAVEAIVNSAAVTDCIVGSSWPLRQALRELVTAARFGSGPILVLGETGTGKELAAQVAHRADPARAGGPLVVVDCTTIVPGLSGSELFGHERGAFTGAVCARSGACASADGGCLFLDEVGELPLDLQPEFMRVIQEGAYKHVGGDRWQHSSFRLICATNRDLAEDVEAGRFRSDLYYRIAASVVQMPPLRDRGDDILELFGYFYRAARGSAAEVALDPLVEAVIRNRSYPGNLRDLRQLAHRVAARHVGAGPITAGDLPVRDRPVPRDNNANAERIGALADGLPAAVSRAVAAGSTLRQLRDDVTRYAIDAALDQSGGKVHGAAQRLGVTDRAVQLRRASDRSPVPTR